MYADCVSSLPALAVAQSERAVSRLAQHGVAIKGSVARSEPGNFAHLEDPDGNEIYLWEKVQQAMSERELMHAAV
jgi:predicted enzyme related to lactoylglutathione lyase